MALDVIRKDSKENTNAEVLTANKPTSEVWVHSGNGNGATATATRRWSTVEINTGSAITYADSANDGGTFTINEDGVYSITYGDRGVSTATFGATRNSSNPASTLTGLTPATGALGRTVSVGGQVGLWVMTLRLSAGDVIRAQHNNDVNATDFSQSFFRITQVAKT